MASSKWTLECAKCGEKNTFGDAKDVQFARWSILAWNMKTGEPVVICNKCEYGKPKEKDEECLGS